MVYSIFLISIPKIRPTSCKNNGFGHGFSVLENNTIINYLQSGNYDPESESGINPLSIKIDWLVVDPILSDRDISLPGINT